MGALFISHSSQNNDQAVRLRDWLKDEGWRDIFLDLDPDQGLAAGQRWQDELKKAGENCSAILLLISRDWTQSDWCRTEFLVAEQLGKLIFPILIGPVQAGDLPGGLSARYQITDISTPELAAAGLRRLAIGLKRAGLDPTSFEWPPPGEPDRSVYRGLQALDAQDAAIFFGRDAAITRGLDRLRLMRGGAPERMLVILGASGAGKSSFLRAGLIARLNRDAENFRVLPIVRPGQAILSGAQGLPASVAQAVGRPIRLETANDYVEAFEDLRRCEPEGATPPTIVLPIDQAEELFGSEHAERVAFCALLADVLRADPNVIVVLTIRSDAYQPLQTDPILAGAPQLLFNLQPMTPGTFQDVIVGPARLARPPIEIEPELTQELLVELHAADALPLLAFTLERLLLQFGRQGRLRLSDYRESMGGLAGAIQGSVVAAIGAFPDAATLALARRLFVPALVQVDQDGVKRRLARREDIPAETLGLADRFVRQRLLTSDRREVAGRESETIEITHEAILRHWPTLASWIAEEQDALRVLGGARAAARDWDVHGRSENWLTHAGERLRDARAVAERADFSAVVDRQLRDYLAACQRVSRRAAARRLALLGVAALLALPLLVVGATTIYAAAVRPLIARYLDYAPYAKRSASLAAAGAGALFQDCRAGSEDCPVMTVIPAGQFLMGAPAGDPAADASERPQHLVRIARFAVSKFDITFPEWRACVDAGGCARNREPDDSGWDSSHRPVINVSWKDAEDYAAWLSSVTGQTYRLLSESEWEYAARAGTASTYFWGDALGVGNANCTGCGSHWDGAQTAPVGSFGPNAFGLYDMAGNVWQWVADCASDDYRGAPADGSARTTGDCAYRGVRGGSWRSVPRSLRASNRDKNSPTDRDDSNGFHIARSL